MKLKREITKELLHELFIIDFGAGSMRRRKNPEKEAGFVDRRPSGAYWKILICGRTYKRSRLVYLAFHGVWPMPTVDHKNRDSLDDGIHNLRAATLSENNANTSRRAKRTAAGSSLPMGVTATKEGGFLARIYFRCKRFCLGTYRTPEEASTVYQAKRRELFGEFAP